MDLPVPGHNISKRALENMRSFTSQVVEESMSLAAEVVRTQDTAVLSNIPGHTSAMLASTLFGIVEATTQIRVLELQLMPSAIKYLIKLYINGYAGNARSGLLKDRLQNPKIILHLSWQSTVLPCQFLRYKPGNGGFCCCGDLEVVGRQKPVSVFDIYRGWGFLFFQKSLELRSISR